MKNKLKTIIILLFGIAMAGGLAWFYVRSYGIQEKTLAPAEKKVLFYYNPMNPDVTSPLPMKDEMGMDYIPVYEEEDVSAGTIRISPEKIQKIGVKSEEVKRRTLKHIVRTVGRVEPIEDKIYVINTKTSGWVEKLYVSQTDQMVHEGERLLELYSPELVSLQEEYLLALKALKEVKDSPYPEIRKNAERLIDAAKKRLKYLDISDDQIENLEKTGLPTRTMTIRVPSRGGITEKMLVEGQKIEMGEVIFRIIDHSVVWVYGEIYEYEIPYVKVGQTVSLYPSYSPQEVYKGKIEHIYSHLGSIRYLAEEGREIRTAKIRITLPNSGHRLKLGMFMNVEISMDVAKNAVAVPDSSVIDSGTRQIVIIDKLNGTFEPKEVQIGAKGDDYYEIRKGVKEGEWVVTSSTFLLDSESNLKAAIGHMGKMGGGEETPKDEPPSYSPHNH